MSDFSSSDASFLYNLGLTLISSCPGVAVWIRNSVNLNGSQRSSKPRWWTYGGSFIFDESCRKYVPACAADLSPSGWRLYGQFDWTIQKRQGTYRDPLSLLQPFLLIFLFNLTLFISCPPSVWFNMLPALTPALWSSPQNMWSSQGHRTR